MSLKRMAMKMALAFAAAKGAQAFRDKGGLQGLKGMLSGGGSAGGATRGAPGGMASSSGGMSGGGGLGGLLGSLGGGGSTGGVTGGGGSLGGLLGALGSGGAAGGGGGMGGLLGGLAAMAGGSAMAGQTADEQTMMQRAEDGPADEETAAVMIRAIGQAVRADGQIDAGERDALNEIIGEADTPEERQTIETALSEPVDPEALAHDVPRGQEAQVYAAALTAIDPDHPAEKDFLNRFARALRMDPAEVEALHRTAGKPA